ncbi:hypothetical protein H8N01_05790 [Streptomyces sp. AC536]|uniref:hypothetical protein n=1 Tax=Streptomyces buecherae TaxID=2763006 RepID=UPI00164D5406|nr:hypothetical protein [Streptomyces buecherae]MBC3982084.1 hypothetical protein [Streptomyces buecherae]QNJ41007.1 hypothetical protein H7H31_15165 [Streptomyces buecherae]
MDALTVAHDVVPYVTAAVAAYGAAVVNRTSDVAADATVSLGQRIAQRLWRQEENRGGLEQAIDEVAADPQDEDAQAALRVQVRRILRQDAALAAELAQLLPARAFTASGDGAVAVETNNGVISTGDGANIRR